MRRRMQNCIDNGSRTNPPPAKTPSDKNPNLAKNTTDKNSPPGERVRLHVVVTKNWQVIVIVKTKCHCPHNITKTGCKIVLTWDDIYWTRRGGGLTGWFFFRRRLFVWRGFWPEGDFCRRGVLARGREGGLMEGGFGRRGVLAGGGFWPEEGFCPEGGFVLFPLTTTVGKPNINCILVSTL